MEHNEIIKALECCYEDDKSCLTCPFQASDKYLECEGLALSALSLIKELTEENERLLARNFDLAEKGENVVIAYKKLSEENERLKAENEMLLNIKNLNIDKVIADTVRKIADLLWQGESEKLNISVGGKYYDKQEFIDQIAKEMLEEGK